MKNMFKNLFRVVLLATLMVAVTSCKKQDSESIAATKIAAGVEATLTAESAINATVEARVQGTKNAIPASVPPTEAGIQPTRTSDNDIEATVEARFQATQTALSAQELQSATAVERSGPVTILSPADGDEVFPVIEVSGFVEKLALEGKFLNVIITTRTQEHWVQTMPMIQADGTWSSAPVYMGSSAYGAGENFTICAVIADQQFPVGQIYTDPDGPEACIVVTRVR